MAFGFLSKLKAMASELVSAAKKHMDADVFQACMAGVVKTGYADGDFDNSEKLKALQFAQNHPAMAAFSATDVKKAFEKYDGIFQLDVSMGQDEADKAIKKICSRDEEARILVIRLMIAIGGADGDFDTNEQAVVRKACGVLGLNTRQFDL